MSKKDAARTPEDTTDIVAAAGPEPQATAAADAVAEAEVKPRKGAGVLAKVKTALGFLKRKRVLIVGGAVALVGLNAWMAVAVDGWRSDDAELRAQNESLGLSLAQAQATAATQVEEIALVTAQASAAQARADELAPVAEEHQAVADSLRAAGEALKLCVADRATLIANLWVSSASAQAGLEAQVNAQCAAAQAALDAIPEEN